MKRLSGHDIKPVEQFTYIVKVSVQVIEPYTRTFSNISLNRGKSPITDPLLIPTPSRISVTIRDINK